LTSGVLKASVGITQSVGVLAKYADFRIMSEDRSVQFSSVQFVRPPSESFDTLPLLVIANPKLEVTCAEVTDLRDIASEPVFELNGLRVQFQVNKQIAGGGVHFHAREVLQPTEGEVMGSLVLDNILSE
jgi:hypothetical protein